jgi:hypothetical protein
MLLKIKFDWYKDTGKWYGGGEASISDNLFLFPNDLILAIHPSCDFWFRYARTGWYLVLDNMGMSLGEILNGKFTKELWTPENILRK